MNWLNGKRRFFNHQIKKITLRKTIVFMLILAMIFESSFFGAIGKFIFAEEYNDGLEYELYVDTSMVGADAELLEDGIGVYLYDEMGNSCTDFPIIMDQVDGKDHLYKLDLDKQYTYVIFTEGSDPYTEERTDVILVDWELGAPVYRLNSEYLTDGGSFYGLYTVYFDLNNAEGSDTFVENGVGVYAYSSETESYSSLPVAMQKSDKGEGIYEYSFDKPYEFIAFMNGYNTWNYDIATAPVYTEWGYDAPCFLLKTVDGEASTGLWRSLNCVVYFDASEIKEDEAFAENGVYLYAYNEKEDGEKEELDSNPVKMLASTKGKDLYEYTLDKPYENVQFVLGDSFDTEIQSEIITIDWLYYAAPCYKMTVDREIIMSEEPSATPSMTPSATPSESPSMTPSGSPSETPSGSPSAEPSGSPTATSSATPSMTPTAAVSVSPEATPSTTPTATPNETPTGTPTVETTPAPVETPEVEPTTEPTEAPEDEDEENDEEKIEPIEDLRDDSDVSSSDSEGTKPIEEARINTNGLSAISGSYRMEWLGSESDLIVQPVEEVIKQNTTIATSTPATTPASNDDTTNKTTQTETPTPVKTDDSNETSGSTEESSPAASAMATSTATVTPTATPENDETTGEVDVYGEVTDLAEGTATTVPRAATFGLTRSSSSSIKTVYFYTTGNGGWNGWTKGGNIYVYLTGTGGNKGIEMMTPSSRQYTLLEPDGDARLWEVTVDTSLYQTVIFVNAANWGAAATQTVNVGLTSGTWADYTHPCFKLDGGSSTATGDVGKKTVYCLGDLGPLSQAGKPMYFIDMTSSVEVAYAEFTGTGTPAKVYADDDSGAFIIPDDETVEGEEVPYTAVTFYDGNDTKIGDSYIFLDKASGDEIDFTYDEATMNTFYYGVTEKADADKTKISTWGAPLTSNEELKGQTLYFDKLFFPVADGGKIQIGDGAIEDLKADSNDENAFSYTFAADSTANQQTVITFIDKSGTEYHFLWSTLTETAEDGITQVKINKVTLNDDIANVTENYVKANTIYFDATLSKLVYSPVTGDTQGTDNGFGNMGIPSSEGNIFYYATGNGKVDLKGAMTLVSAYTQGSNTWSDVYKVDLPEGYTNIAFSAFEMTSIEDYGWKGNSTTKLTIPTDIKNPCFYADSSDDVIFNNSATNQRSGYWDEIYSIRDPEKEGSDSNTITVVDIPTGTETRENNKLYLSTTFYDFYTDYELNGANRDDYSDGYPSHRIYQPFRQFNQALSAYYENNNAASPLYWGNFQNYEGSHYSEIADDLKLFDYAGNSKKFFYENNSMWALDGSEIEYKGANATLGLVSDELVNGKLMIKTASGTVVAPFLNADFLSGNNAKNTVLGKVYEDVSFPFSKEKLKSQSTPTAQGKVEYWVFNSSDASTNLRMQQDSNTGSYYLATSGDVVKGETVGGEKVDTNGMADTAAGNFFPFNGSTQSGNSGKLNYGFASKIEFKFRLTKDGKVTTDYTDGTGEEKVPIEFNFSGDDDVWIFIDGKLALDIGGGHGAVTGYLNFADRKYYVSAVKTDTGYQTDQTGSFELANLDVDDMSTEEHTLTMFYMERGLWESNMSISFNFPDENQLEIEKQVDESNVNQELFAGVFNDASIFPFTVSNLATHYGTKAVELGDEVAPLVYNDTFNSSEISKASSSNKMEQIASWNGKTNVVHWYAQYYDDSKGTYLSKRWGTILPTGAANSVDISNTTKYLQFSYYASSATPALNKMYIELEDTAGDKIGGYLNSKVYGTPSMKKNAWGTITVELEELQKKSDGTLYEFDFTNLKNIKFSYNDPVNFYLDDFTFLPATTVSKLTGFVTKQEEIPDYGSATSGKLELANGALYTLTDRDGDSDYYRVNSDGQFVLADDEVALFRDQFRRGSYIALEEEVDATVFSTTWTMYEDGLAVTSMTDGSTVDLGATTSLKDVNSLKVDDGRTEVWVSGLDSENVEISNSGYTSSHRPTDNEGNAESAFVFRSYSNPDADKGLTKLRVTYTNKVKVGSLKLTKADAKGSDPLTGEYTFLVTFHNVAGMGLEGDRTITKTITLKDGESEVITGIPVNTEFSITETTPEDKSFLKNVTEANGDTNFTFNFETKELNGKIVSEGQAYDFTFENMLKPVINIDLEKKWQNADGSDLTDNIPESIRIRIQRRVKKAETETQEEWEDFNIDYQEARTQEELNALVEGKILLSEEILSPGYEGWKRSFWGLNKYVDNTLDTKELWEYRIVEVKLNTDGTSTIISEGGVLGNFQVYYDPDSVVGKEAESADTDTEDETYSYAITNISTVTLQITKKNKTGDAIAGVSFTLEKQDSSGGWIKVSTKVTDPKDNSVSETYEVTTDSSGIGTFVNLPYGTYRLTETKTAEGYTLLKDPIIIEIGENGYMLDSETDYTNIENNLVTVNIVNNQNLVLPPTGGSGPIPFTVGGIALCSIASLMYIDTMRKRRKEDKAS